MKELLRVKNFSVFYSDNVIDNVSFSLNQGNIIGLVGRNGCGKSTLLKGIMGSLKTSGDVLFCGENFLEMSIKQRAKNISMLTQRIEIIDGISVYDLISLGNYAYWKIGKRKNDAKINEITKLLNLENLLDKDYSILSEGQKQLVNFARILMQDTPIMLLDEPDSALDFDNRHMLFQKLCDLAKNDNKAIMLVIHNPLDALNYCNQVLLLDEGKIISKIYPLLETSEEITQKIRLIYPNIIIKKDVKQFYSLIE